MKIRFFFSAFLLLTFYACSYLPEDELRGIDNIDYQETTEYIKLSASSQPSNEAFLFVPGGLVDPHAYISLMEKVVLQGTTVIIAKVAANLAILETSKPLKLIDDIPEINSWYIGGHSLGGIAALSVISKSPDSFKGLILLGSYPTESFSIADWEGNALCLFGENDQLSTIADIEAAKPFMPTGITIDNVTEIDSIQIVDPVTLYYMIAGGNHAQFGDYGPQAGDGSSTISTADQHTLVSSAILNFIHWNESL